MKTNIIDSICKLSPLEINELDCALNKGHLKDEHQISGDSLNPVKYHQVRESDLIDIDIDHKELKNLNVDLVKVISTGIDAKVKIVFTDKIRAFLINGAQETEIKYENLPKELAKINTPELFNGFLRDVHARTSYCSSNGDIILHIYQRLKGGISYKRIREIAEKSETQKLSKLDLNDIKNAFIENDGDILNKVSFAFCNHIKKTNKLISEDVIVGLLKALSNANAQWNANISLKEASRAQRQKLLNSILETLSSLLSDNTISPWVKKNSLSALLYSAQNQQKLTDRVIFNLENSLYDNDETIINSVVNMFYYVAKQGNQLSEACVLELEKATSHPATSLNASATLLKIIKTQGQKIPHSTLEKLSLLCINESASKKARINACNALYLAMLNGQKIPKNTIININGVLSNNGKKIINGTISDLDQLFEEYKLPQDDVSNLKAVTFVNKSKVYKDFRQELAINRLKNGYKLDRFFHLQAPEELKYITRKHSVIHEDLALLCNDIISKSTDDKTRLLLSQTVKYSIRRGSEVEFNSLINVLKASDSDEIKSEITYALGYKIKNSKESIKPDIIKEIKQSISGGINTEAQSFLNDQIQKQQDISDGNSWKINYGKIKVSTNYSRNVPQAVVTKNQQTIKVSYKNSQSEELAVSILSLADALKNRNKKIKINSNVENLPTVLGNGGDDRSFWRGTYVNVKNLYQRAINNQLLKTGDKDDYLVKKLINNEEKWFAGSFLGSFLIDRMIVATFLEISSRKQNRQLLNNAAINKIVSLSDSLSKVKELVYNGRSDADMAKQINAGWKPKSDLNSIEKNLSTKISRILDTNEVSQLMDHELDQLRIDAIKTIYHNSTSTEGKCLTKEHIQQIENCIHDTNKEFKKFTIKILSTLVDSKEIDYSKLFNACLEQLESNVDLEQSIIYINQQTKDPKRCKELFDKKTILRISNLLKSSFFDNQTKVSYCEIINNYLEYGFTDGLLDDEGLKNCSNIIESPAASNELKTEALRSILLTAEKAKTLPVHIVQSLVKNLDSFEDKSANFVVMTLGTICENFKKSESEIENINEVSNKLLDDRVIVGEGSNITFEQRSKDNLACSSISSIASRVFVNYLGKKGAKITEKSLEHLVSALDSNDKQTRILSAKSLSIAASSSVIDNTILVKLREYVEDRVLDVATYTAVVYTEGLAKLAQGKPPIAASHIEFLPVVYAFKDLRLGDENFTDQVNKNVLSVLLNEAGKQEFDEKVFGIFDHILFSDEGNNDEAIDILEQYTTNKYKIPRNTIAALENALGIAEVSDKAVNVLENVIRNGQAVSDKTLQIFTDNLYLSEDRALRVKSFELLDIADDNQDLSDEMFSILELERAGHVITEYQRDDKTNAILYLSKQTDDGRILSINTFEALINELNNERVLSILCNASKNRQIIPNYLVDKLERKFDPQQDRHQLLEIFANISINNQNISSTLLEKLEKALDNPSIADQILSIFALQTQKGASLSTNVVNGICNKLLTTDCQAVKQELYSAISSVIQKENNFDPLLIQKALIPALTDENQNIVNSSVNAFRALAAKINLNKESIDALTEKAINVDCPKNIKDVVFSILHSDQLSDSQATRLKLADLNCDSNDKLLDEISELSKHSDLLEQNFQQINLIIDRFPDSRDKAIDVLASCLNKKDIPEELINSIATLMASTTSEKIESSCCRIIGQIAQAGTVVSDNVISLIASRKDQKLVKSTLKIINQNKNQKVSNQVSLYLQLNKDLPSIDLKLTKLLKEIYKELKNGFKLSSTAIKKLVNKYKEKSYSNITKFTDVLALICQQDYKSRSNASLVGVIEQVILSKKINSNIINGYTKIIQSKSYQNLTGVVDSLAEVLQEGNKPELNLTILACIASASQVAEIPEKGLVVLENNIDSSDENIRSLSFKGLRVAQDQDNGYKSDVFESWCNNVIANLEHNIDAKVEPDMDLLDTLSSLKYVDLSKITKKPQAQWSRELLLSDLLAKFKISEGEKFNFYKNWLNIEQQEEFKGDRSDKILKCIHSGQANNMVSFDRLNDIIVKFLPNIDFETAHNILLTSSNQYTNLKQQWLKTILNQRLQDKQVNTDYIDKLASNIGTRFSTDVADKFLHSIATATIDNPREFELLLDFAEINKIKVSDIKVQNVTVGELKRSLEIKFLGNQIQRPVDRYKLSNTLNGLLNQKWTFEQLNAIFSNLITSNTIAKVTKEKSLIQVLEILDQYKLPPLNYKKILMALNKSPEEWLKEVNAIAVESHFQKITIKNTTELLKEAKDNNPNNESLQHLINNDLSGLIEQVKSTKLKSKIDLNQTSTVVISNVISKWSKNDITLWARAVKKNTDYFKNTDSTIEALAVVKQANFLETSFDMTDSQILSCLVALNANQTQGRLLQVATGEGKSTIVSVLAIINALKGKKVDIITSSPVLAERDAKEKAKLYKMFGLNCSDNNDKSVYIKGAKDCYKKDIVYGEAAQFQFDTLRDEYSQLGTLAGRKCEVAIVDEVDSMLIDDSSKIARLATTIAGLDQLQPIYHFLWQRLVSMQEKVVEIEGKMYLLYGKLSYEQDKMVLEYADDKEDIIQVSDLKSYIKSTKDISNIGQPIEGEIEVFLKKHLEDYVKELISKNDKNDGVKIPSNFKEFVEKQIHKWVNNAVVAFGYQENTHYIVQEGVIKPVDYNSTGIVQSSTNWSDGLHQFLQIKHSLKMTSETFTTNFLSNMGYFKRYGSNLFGLTGTLGSEKAKEVLSDVYEVDLINIPNLRKKQYLELPTIVTSNENKWLNEICSSAINEANKERGTLIICETIQHTKIIAGKLREEYRTGAIKLYTMNDMNQEREVEKINPGEIIIATNLAGRGTDIKTDDIEKNGGMHVIVTFMPSNQRVEEQAFGRTARQGKRGTGQMILNAVNLMKYGEVTPQQVKELRNNFESEMLDEFRKKELKVIATKDKLFNEFCLLLNEIRQDIREKSGIWKHIKDSVKNIVTNVTPSVHETNVLSAIEEQWAMFLRKVDDGVISIEQADQEYKKFSDQINKDYKSDVVIKNPYYHIAIANDLVINDSSLNDKYDLALSHFDEAIKLDEQYSAAAYVGKGWLLLKGKERFWTANDQSTNYKQQAIIEFEKALGVLNYEMASLNAMQAVLQQQHTDIKSDLSKQLIQKVNILGSYSSSIQNAVSTIKKSQRLIDITAVRQYQNTTEKDEDSIIKRDDYDTKISKVETSYYGIARNSEGKIEQSLDNCDEFKVVFNDLTVKEDSGAIDQAIDTINTGYLNTSEYIGSNAILDKKYNGISINLKQINAERLQVMLSTNIEIKEATKEVAMAQLKNKSSFFHRHLLPERWSPNSSKINLEIILDNEKLETQENLQARDALKIIENQKDDNLHFNLTFINANEVSQSLKEILQNSSLNIECVGLNWQNAQNKLDQIQSKAISLEITGSKEEIAKAIDHPKVRTVQFFNSKENISETIYTHEAKKKIDQIESDNLSIRIENLDSSSSNEIINLCKNASFNINFIAVNSEASLQGLNEGQLNVSFDNLGKNDAINLIPQIRKENMDFVLVFKHLNNKQVEGIIQKASLDQENIEISKVKTLNELFMEEAKSTLELSEFAARGIEYLLEINEKRFIPWRSVIAVGALASIQMAAGGVLVATGFGATVGMGLITEGGADILTAYRAYSTRQFTWSDYMKQKAVSLVISAACMGWSKIKDAGKGMKNLAVGVGEEVLEQAGTQVITNGKTVGEALIHSGKNLKSLAFKQMGVAAGEALVREGFNKVADALSHFALEQFKPQISASIQSKVNTKFCQSNLMSLVRKIHALDSINKSQKLKEKVDNIVAETINPEHNFWKKQWDSVGGPLCKGILSDSKYLGSPFSMAMRALGTLNGMHQITSIIDSVHDQLVRKLSQIDKETLSMPQLLHQHCGITQKDAREIVEILRKEDIIQLEENNNTTLLDHVFHHAGDATLKKLNPLAFHYEYVNPLAFDTKKEFKSGINQLVGEQERYNQIVSEYKYPETPKTTIDKVNLHNHNKSKNDVINFCKLLHENTLSVQIDDLSQIMKSISNVITDQVIRITESQLISPWSSYSMGALTNIISLNIQDKIIQSQLTGEMKSIDEQIKNLENKENKTPEDINKIKELKVELGEKQNLSNTTQTYSGLINYDAKKYTIAYSQCENIHYVQQKSKNSNNLNNQVSKEVKNHAEAVKKDKPADIADMFAMATENCIDLKIVDDPNYQLTEEEKAKGTKIAVFTKGDKDIEGKEGVGHYQLLSSDGKSIIDIPSNGNDCGYAVFAKLTGKSVEQLRNETAQSIEANSDNFSKAIEAQNWIQNHYPKEANGLLFSGGCTSCHNIKVDDKEYILALADGKQILVKKTWYKTIKDSSGLVKTVTFVLIATGEIGIILSGGGLAPVLVPVIFVAEKVYLGAMATKVGNELYKTGSEHGVISREFGEQIINQLKENAADLLSLSNELGVSNEHSLFTTQLKKIISRIKIISDIDYDEIRPLMAEVKKIRRSLSKGTNQQEYKRITGGLAILEKLIQIYNEKESISNIVCDIANTKDLTQIQNKINSTNITNPSELKRTVEDSREYTVEPIISIQALTVQKELLAKKHYGNQWDKLNNERKSIVLAHLMKNKEYLDLTTEVQIYSDSKLEREIKEVLDSPDKKHTFCKNEEEMLAKTGPVEEQAYRQHVAQ